jgi:hypothetical protein
MWWFVTDVFTTGLPTCSDSTSSPIIRDRSHPFRMNALLHAENIDRRAGDTLKRAQSMMMAGMDSAPPGSEDWGHGVGDWNEWLKEWDAYKKTAAYQKARALQAEVRHPCCAILALCAGMPERRRTAAATKRGRVRPPYPRRCCCDSWSRQPPSSMQPEQGQPSKLAPTARGGKAGGAWPGYEDRAARHLRHMREYTRAGGRPRGQSSRHSESDAGGRRGCAAQAAGRRQERQAGRRHRRAAQAGGTGGRRQARLGRLTDRGRTGGRHRQAAGTPGWRAAQAGGTGRRHRPAAQAGGGQAGQAGGTGRRHRQVAGRRHRQAAQAGTGRPG